MALAGRPTVIVMKAAADYAGHVEEVGGGEREGAAVIWEANSVAEIAHLREYGTGGAVE